MSAAGLTALTKDEGSVDGLYDDPSALATSGVFCWGNGLPPAPVSGSDGHAFTAEHLE
jgi:hypothetical protein